MSDRIQESFDDKLLEDVRYELKEPDMWRVVLLNDDYTPRDFVVEILVSIFHKPPVEAANIMLEVHNKGRGVVGVYPYDIGKTKVNWLKKLARAKEYPLQGILERVK